MARERIVTKRRIWVLADAHIGHVVDGRDGSEWLALAIDDARRNLFPIDYAVFLGDSSHRYAPEQFRDYIDEINSPWVAAYFDIGNCRKFGPAEDWVRTLGTRIVKLDVKDWGQDNGFCRLGEGDVDWPEVRKALAETGFSGWATREGADNSLEDTAALMDELLDL